MNRNHNRAKREKRTLQVWTYEEAKGAAVYIGSILRSLRESRLEAGRQNLQIKRLEKEPGRPSTAAIIALEEARREARRTAERYREALQELHSLDVYCLDSLNGLALVPFVQDDQLAWFVFDLFDTDPLRHWRYHTDDLETRRPIAAVLNKSAGGDLVV